MLIDRQQMVEVMRLLCKCAYRLRRIQLSPVLVFALLVLVVDRSDAVPGPILYVGNYGRPSQSEDAPFFRLADNVDEDAIFGSAVLVDPISGDVIGLITDFDDLHTFNVVFDEVFISDVPYSGAVDVANVFWIGGDDDADAGEDTFLPAWQAAEAIRVHDWHASGYDGGAARSSDVHWSDSRDRNTLSTSEAFHSGKSSPAPRMGATPDGGRKNGFGIIYGIRHIDRQDYGYVHLRGSILHNSQWETEAENHIIGPQLGAVAIKSIGRWSVRLQASVMAGFNYGDVRLKGLIGEGAVPGALNQALYFRPTPIGYKYEHDEFSPSGELRLEGRYHLTKNITFAITWSEILIGNALSSWDRVDLTTPMLGLRDPGEQFIYAYNVFCGVEIVR